MNTGDPLPGAVPESVVKHQEYSGGHRKAEVVIDDTFPGLQSNLPISKPDDFAFIVSYEQNLEIMKHTPTTGRAGFYPLTFEAGDQTYNSLFVKGTGMPEIYVQAAGSKTAFSVHHREENKDLFRIIGYKPDVLGLCTREDQILDAEQSLQLQKVGVKVRVPLKGFFLEEIETEKGLENTASLKEQGLLKESERPYMSYWAMETPYRVDDLNRAISDFSDQEIRSFLINANRYTANLKEERYGNFRQDFEELINNSASTADLLELWTNFVLENCKVSFKQLMSANVIHRNLHAQNVTLHGEICDNSEITIETDSQLAAQGHASDIKVFFDGFSNIWKTYCEKTGVDSSYKERFDRKVDNFFK